MRFLADFPFARKLLLIAVTTLAASASAAEVRSVAAASVTRTVNGDGRLDLVFVNQSSMPLGFSLYSLKATPEASPSCWAEALRLEKSPSRTSIMLMGQRYVTDTPSYGWAHRQLHVPASLMDIGCTLRLLVDAISDDAGPQAIEPALIIPLRTGYWTQLDLPLARGPAPAAAAYSEFNLSKKIHVAHILYRFSGDASGSQEVVANANVRCAKGTLVTLTLPHSDRKLQDHTVLVGPGQWSGLVLWAKAAVAGDGCSVTAKLVRGSSEGRSRTPAAEVTVQHELTHEREFVPDGPIP